MKTNRHKTFTAGFCGLLGIVGGASLLACMLPSAHAQDFYNASTSGGGGGSAARPALQEGGVGQELGMSDETADGEGFSPLSLLARKPFKITVSVREGYDSNVNTTKTNVQSSMYTNFAAGMIYNFGSPRLKLTTSLTGGYTYYYNKDVQNNNRFSGLWDFAAIYTVSPRMTISAVTTTGYYSQPNVTVAGTNISQQGDYFNSITTIAALYQWATRFSTTTAYTFAPIVYVDSNLNDEQGRIQQTFSQSFNFMWRPTTTLVAEYRISPTTYFSADLNSLDQYALLGFDHVFSPRSSWNLRAGAQVNLLDNPVDGSSTYIGPYGETAFIYRYGDRSQISTSLRYGTEASGLNNVTQRQSLRFGAGLTHAFTPRLIGNAGAFYGVNYYDQNNVIDPFYENVFEGSLGLTYEFNRFLSTSAGYRFTGVLSPEQNQREYNRNIVFLGLNASF